MRRPLLIAFVSLLLPLATMAAITFENPTQGDDLSDPRSITTIDEQVYIMNHRKLQNGEHVKELYLLESPETTATLLNSEHGSLSADDHVAEFGDALYHTVTRKRGRAVQIFRSTDGGDDWELAGKVGFADYDIKNEVQALFATDGRLYVVVAPQKRFDDKAQRIGVWSTADGTTWKKHLFRWDRNQELIAAFAWNNRPFVLMVGRAAESSPVTRLYTTLQANGKSFQQSAENNISSSDQVEIAKTMVTSDDRLFIVGTGVNGEDMSLVSDDGITWEATDPAFTQIVTIDDALLATSDTTLYTSSDGVTWSEVTLSFEDELEMNGDINRWFATAQDGSGIGVRVWSEDDESDAECWWSANGVSWSALTSCIPVRPSRSYRAVVAFDDFWYGIRGKQSHVLYRFEL